LDENNFSRWKSNLNSKAYVWIDNEDIENWDDVFTAHKSGEYYFVFYNDSVVFKKISIKMTLIKSAEENPTTSVQTSTTREKVLPIPSSYSSSGTKLTVLAKDFNFYYWDLDDNFETEIRIGATQPINFYIMGSYDFEKWLEARQISMEKFAAYKKYQAITQLHNIFIAPTRDKYYFVFENTQSVPVDIDFNFSFK
jgi:hypothetical protein